GAAGADPHRLRRRRSRPPRGEPAAPAPAARERSVLTRAVRAAARELPLRSRAGIPGRDVPKRLRGRGARHPAPCRRDPDDAAPTAGPRPGEQGGVFERRLADPRALLAGRGLGAAGARGGAGGRRGLAMVLAELVALGARDADEALTVGRRVLGENAAGIYGLPWP